jgi:hypothetical protein
MTHGSKGKITEQHGNLSMDEASTGATRGEAGLIFIFWLLLVLLIWLPTFGRSKAMIEAKDDMRAINKEGLTLVWLAESSG